MILKKKKIGELEGTPIVTGDKNYANEHEYYMTLKDDNTYEKLEQRVNGDKFKVIFSDDSVYIGEFYIKDLPVLDGLNDFGKVARVKDTSKTAYWDGSDWKYLDGKLVIPCYLTFTANEDGSSVGFIIYNNGYELPEDFKKPVLEYSIDGGKTWQDYDFYISSDPADATPIELNEGESVMFRGNNENLAYYLESEDDWLVMQAYIGGTAAASGDITSLLNGVGGDVAVSEFCYNRLFRNCTSLMQAPTLPSTTLSRGCYVEMFGGCEGLTQAPVLPATSLAEQCYSFMFSGCTGLTRAPALPATSLAMACYGGMFRDCTGLTQAPVLPATSLAEQCYSSMFSGCTGLTEGPVLPVTTLVNSCYSQMFKGCTGLTQAPTLPATTLAISCYLEMFKGCTGLTQAPTLPATTLAANCYYSMFSDCTSINSYDVATLNSSMNVFQNNSSCASLTIHSETPPTIANNTITGLKADCVIYVPAASVNAYKAAQYWSARASYIQAIPSGN